MVWHELANDSRQAATLLFRKEHYRSISRAYYAAYSAVVGVLCKVAALRRPVDRQGPAHAKVPQLIRAHWPVAEQRKRHMLAHLLQELYRMRLRADYHPDDVVDKEEARLAVGLMSKTWNLVY